jgi:serine phosphatase RsbU (regulator of sigma subunit)
MPIKAFSSRSLLLPLLLLLLLLLSPVSLCAQGFGAFTLTADKLKDGKAVGLDNLGWKYQAGDEVSWADPGLDDSSWDALKDTKFTPENLPRSGWHGRGWFRLHLRVDPSLEGQPLALLMGQWGASEIYLDGHLIQSFGKVGATPEDEQAFDPKYSPRGIAFDSADEHLLAVRLSINSFRDISSGWGRWLEALGFRPGFRLSISNLNSTLTQREASLRSDLIQDVLDLGVCAAIGLLHLLIFLYYPRQRANLFFSLTLFSVAANILVSLLISYGNYDVRAIAFLYLSTLLTSAGAVFTFLPFLYTAFKSRIPKYFWAALCLWSLLMLGRIIAPGLVKNSIPSVMLTGFFVVEALRAIISALRKRLDGAWIVGVGVLLLALVPAKSFLASLVYELPRFWNTLIDQLGIFGLIIALSLYLARNFARTSSRLEEQLVREIEHERERARMALVEAENERRAQELDEARQLQLSMLPRSVPQLTGLEIAAYMKPATEVGGDYYDFHVGDDGTLTVAVGDATGHGLKAGTMVTAAKSLFNNLAPQADITHIFKQTSPAIRKMNLRGLFMAMIMLKVKEGRLAVSAAGMPPMLIYRAATNEVEEVAIRAMPLGSLQNISYRQRELSLAAGDTILLMSDGFPEMFNEAGETLDYGKARMILEETARAASPQEIISHFVQVGEQWANGRPQDDDVTFVVIKVTGDREVKGN